MAAPKTLCNFGNGIMAVCAGAGRCFDELKELCDGAQKSSYGDTCMHMCEPYHRCDSYVAQDIAAGIATELTP